MSSKETKNKSKLYLSALLMLAATAVLSTVTSTGNNVFAQDNSDDESHGNSDNVVDNGNAGEGDNGDTQAGSVSSHDNDENNANTEEEETTTTDSNTESDSETTTDSSSGSDSDSDTQQLAAAATDPTPGVGNNDNPLGQDNPQPGRVGSHDDQTSPESNPGGTVTDPTLCDITTVDGCSTEVDKNCFGKVISERAQDHKEDPEEGTLGSHARDPVPELPGNETPRQGIGNQDQGHPAATRRIQ